MFINDNLFYFIKEGKVAKKDNFVSIFLEILRWTSLILAILLFIWLAKLLEWIRI